MPSGPKRISGWGVLFLCVSFIAAHNSLAAASVATLINCGWHCAACAAASFTFWPAAMATTWNFPGLVATTSRHWRPMEPVEPRMEIRFICLRGLFYRGSGWNANFGFGVCVVAWGTSTSKDLTQRTQRKSGEKSDKDKRLYRRDEGYEKKT